MSDIRSRAESQALIEMAWRYLAPGALIVNVLIWGTLGLELLFSDAVNVQGILGSLALTGAGWAGGRLLMLVLPRRSDVEPLPRPLTWLLLVLVGGNLSDASEPLSTLGGWGVAVLSIVVGVGLGAASTLPAEPERYRIRPRVRPIQHPHPHGSLREP